MANRYQMAVEFTLLDGISKKLDAISGSGNFFTKQIEKTQARLKGLGSFAVNMGKQLAVDAIGAVSAGLVSVTGQYIEFEQSLRAAGAAFSDLDASMPDYEEKLTELGKTARDVAAATEFNAVQASAAMATFARAGIDSSTAISLLPGTADVATAAFVSLDEGVNMVVGGLNTMGLMSKSPEELSANMKRLGDMMAYTADSANMSIIDVSEAITQGGSFFKTANNTLDTFSASLTALANNSIRGAEAGVHLRNIMTNLSAPTAKAEATLKKLGITTTDSSGNLLNISEIVGQFNKALDGMGDAEKNESLYNIFGKQNIAAMTALLNTGEEALRQFEAASASSTGAANAKAEAIRKSLGNQIEVLKSALTEKGFQFIEKFQGKTSDAILRLNEFIASVDVGAIADKLLPLFDKIVDSALATATYIQTHWDEIVEEFGKVAGQVKFVVDAIWNMRGAIVPAITAFFTFKRAMNIVAVGSAAITTFKEIGKNVKMFSDGFQAAKMAMDMGVQVSKSSSFLTNLGSSVFNAGSKIGSFAVTAGGAIKSFAITAGTAIASFATSMASAGAALLTNPITWIILGIVVAVALLAFGIYELVKHWDVVSEKMKEFGAWIAEGFMTVWNGLVNAFTAFGAWISGVFTSIWDGLVNAFTTFADWIANVFTGIWQGVKDFVGGVLDFFIEKVQTLIGWFTNGGIINGIRHIGAAILGFLLTPLQTILELISKIPGIGDIASGINEKLDNFKAMVAGEEYGIAPTQTTAQADSYAYSESVNNSRVTIGLENGLTADNYQPAPAVTVQRTRSGRF